MSGVRVEVEGLPELIRALRGNAGLAKPLEQALNQIGLEQLSESVRAAPRNFGKLQNSIKFEVDRSPLPGFVRVGTIGSGRPAYAAYMEFGTGLVHDHPSWPRKRHIVPAGALTLWAKRVGAEAGPVARAITRRGGLEPRRYLRGPFEANRTRYVRLISEALRRMTLG
jgi:hypothetical protein